jgi:hypothetical protein
MNTCRVNVTMDYPQAVQMCYRGAKLSEYKHKFLGWKVDITEWFPGWNVFRWLCFKHKRSNFFKQDGWFNQTKNIWMLHIFELSGKFESHFTFFSWQERQIDEG